MRRGDEGDLARGGPLSIRVPVFRHQLARQARRESVVLVAEQDGALVAQIWVDLVLKRPAGAGLLWALRVAPAFERRGIGTRLVLAAEDAVRDAGLALAELTVDKENSGALRLYERLGWSVTRELRDEAAGKDLWVMRKSLGGAERAPP